MDGSVSTTELGGALSEETGYPYGDDKQPAVADGGGWWDLFQEQGVTYDLLTPDAERRLPGEAFERVLSTLNDRQKHIHEFDASERLSERLNEHPESQPDHEQEGRH